MSLEKLTRPKMDSLRTTGGWGSVDGNKGNKSEEDSLGGEHLEYTSLFERFVKGERAYSTGLIRIEE